MLSTYQGETFMKFRALMPVVAAVGLGTSTLAEHAVKAVDKQIDGFVAIIAGNASDKVRTSDFNVPFRDKRGAVSLHMLE